MSDQDAQSTDLARLAAAQAETSDAIALLHKERAEADARVAAARADAWAEGAFYGLGWPAALGHALMSSNPYRRSTPGATEEADHG